MSRGQKLTKAAKKPRRPSLTSEQRQQAVLQDLLDGVVCSRGAADDHAAMCDARLADVDTDLALAQIAATLWHGRQGPAAKLGIALDELVNECRRHQAALEDLYDRLDAMSGDEALHDHLDPSTIDPEALRRALSGATA